MIYGEERLFRTNTRSINDNNYYEFYLRYLGEDHTELKMIGDFPKLWIIEDGEINGPELFDDDHVYRVINVDYDYKLIWLEQL